MKGYLMQEQPVTPGDECFIESFSPENNYGVVFEDDGETGYFYAVEKDKEGGGLRVLDALHIYETGSEAAGGQAQRSASKVLIIWSRDWLKCALVMNGHCQALFDFEAQGGYNVNEFPPPNEIWTKEGRKLTDELVQRFF